MCVVGFALFCLAWICWLILNFATGHRAVTLDIYRSELFHNPLFWLSAAIFAALFAIAQVAAGEIRHKILRSQKRTSSRTHSAGSFG